MATRATATKLQRTCLTLDELSLAALSALQENFQMTRAATVRTIFEQIEKREVTERDLRKFYLDVWLTMSPTGKKKVVRFNFSEVQDVLLDMVANRVIALSSSRSEALRMLIAYAAIRAGVAEVDWVKKSTLSWKKAAGGADSKHKAAKNERRKRKE